MSVPSAPRQGAASKNRDPCPNKKCTPRLHLLGDAASWALLLLLISLSLDLGFVHCYGEYQPTNPNTSPTFLCAYSIQLAQFAYEWVVSASRSDQ